MKIAEMMDMRRDVMKRLSQLENMRRPLQTQLDDIDRDLFSRIRTLAAAIDGEPVTPKPAADGALQWPKKAGDGVPLLNAGDGPVHAAALASAAVALRDYATKKSEPGVFMQYVVDALRDINRPATRNELFEHLTAKGIAIPGKDPKANLSAHLSYSDDIVRVGNAWALKQKEIEERQTPTE